MRKLHAFEELTVKAIQHRQQKHLHQLANTVISNNKPRWKCLHTTHKNEISYEQMFTSTTEHCQK